MGLLVMRFSFKKLQKLLNDLYSLGNQKINNLSQALLLFPDYLKVSVSITKKAFNSSRMFINSDALSLLAILASAA
jgi:hypothetical protein